jgi:hypothetical protein
MVVNVVYKVYGVYKVYEGQKGITKQAVTGLGAACFIWISGSN